MSEKRLPRPRDPVQLGKLIFDILTGQVEDRAPDRPEDPQKDQAAVSLGSKGGLKGGTARAAKMTPDMHYNFVRIHQTLKVTPSMAAGNPGHGIRGEDRAR
jgi:hypothetical protein